MEHLDVHQRPLKAGRVLLPAVATPNPDGTVTLRIIKPGVLAEVVVSPGQLVGVEGAGHIQPMDCWWDILHCKNQGL